MDLIGPMRAFVRVYETGSFSALARAAGTTQATVSRRIAALETHLGARLFERTTRAVTPTEAGRRFYESAAAALDALAEAEAAVKRGGNEVSGTLRLACPVAFGRLHVVPRLPKLLARHRALKLDLILSDAFADLVEEGIDLALRIGEVTEAGLSARRIGETRRVTVASPAYLKAHGAPATPRDLAKHDCVIYTRLTTGARWVFAGPDGPIEVAVDGRFRANNSEAVREAVLAGLGIGVVPVWLFGDEIARKRVRVLLPDFEPKRLPISAVRASRRFEPAKTRAAIDFLAAEFRLDPLLSDYRA
jgi:DNA-binding transcriptional LysR family regulator